MRAKKLVWAIAGVFLAATLTSCNIGKAPEPTVDANAIYTSAAQTMIAGLNAQQTQTAAAVPPTSQASPTPLVSPTPLATFAISTGSIPFGTPFTLGTPGVGVTARPTLPAGTGVYSFPVGADDAMYIGDTGPKDRAKLKAGEKFDVCFSMQNVGTSTWDEGYSFSWSSGERFSVNRPSIVISDKSEFVDPGHSQAFCFKLIAPSGNGEYKGFWQMKNDAGTAFGSKPWVWITVGNVAGPTATP
jgi:Ig-like domain-containing protein